MSLGYRRKGIASLPITIFFVALVAIAFVGINAVTSGQSGLANKQVYVENMLAARQQELHGLSAFSSGNGMLQLTQNFGVTTNIVYVIAQMSNGQTFSEPVNYVIPPGRSQTVDLTSLVQQMFGGTIPSGLTNITLVTSRGIYITSHVQTVQQQRQVTTYQQQQVTQTVPQFAGYSVSKLSSTYFCPNGGSLQGSTCVSSYSATWNPGYYSCPSGWTLALFQKTCYQVVTTVVNVPGHWTTQTQLVWVPGYWAYNIQSVTETVYDELLCYVLVPASGCYIKQVTTCSPDMLCWPVGTKQVLVTVPYYVPGYWTTQTVQVWVPGYQEFVTQTYTMGSIWHPGTYSCPNGGSLQGSTCVSSYQAQLKPSLVPLGLMWSCPSGSQYICSPVFQPYSYTVTKTVPVTKTVYTTVLQTVSSWLIGG